MPHSANYLAKPSRSWLDLLGTALDGRTLDASEASYIADNLMIHYFHGINAEVPAMQAGE
jgi:hypothetical protein